MLRHARRLGLVGLTLAAIVHLPSAAAAAPTRDCGTPAAFGKVAAWGSLTASGVSCRYAVRIAMRHQSRLDAFDDEVSAGGFTCKLTAKRGAQGGGDPFVRYRCERGSRWLRYILVF